MVHTDLSSGELDRRDPLAEFRQRFVFPDPDLIYLDGNSLGRLPVAAADAAHELVHREWGARLIRSWNETWLERHRRVGAKLSRLLGADEGEVAVADSTSVNLFKLVVAALDARPGRSRIVTDDLNFPTDHYILQGAVELLGGRHRIDVVASGDGIHGPEEALRTALDDDVALVTLSHVTYTSGYLYDMAGITAAAHDAGALTLWDLSHSAGSVPVELGAAGADLAVGCTYKYLNGGPGAPAYLYVRRDLHGELHQPVTGWFAHRAPFAFGPDFEAAPGIERFLSGTPPMAGITTIEPGVDLLLEAGMDRLRAKSLVQTGQLIDRWRDDLAPLGFELRTPEDPERRGSHVSLAHPEALGVDLALIEERNVVPDFRPPDHLRLGIAPLYTRHVDIDTAVDAMVDLVTSGSHRRYLDAAPTVV